MYTDQKYADRDSSLTIGELERDIAQKLQKLWKEKTGQFPRRAIALFFEKKLVVWLDGILTPLEKSLAQVKALDNAGIDRRLVDQVLKREVQQCLATVLTDCQIEAVLIDSDLAMNCSAVNVLLNQLPAVRNLEVVPKSKTVRNQKSESCNF